MLCASADTGAGASRSRASHRDAMLRDRRADPKPDADYSERARHADPDADYSDRTRHAQPIMDKASPPRPKDRKRRDAWFISR